MTPLLAQTFQIFFALPAFVLNRPVTREEVHKWAQYSYRKKKSRFTGLRASVACILFLALINSTSIICSQVVVHNLSSETTEFFFLVIITLSAAISAVSSQFSPALQRKYLQISKHLPSSHLSSRT